jgi:hypothetical protein
MELVYDVAGNDVTDLLARRLECEIEPIKCTICGKTGDKNHRLCFILRNKLKRINEQIEKLNEKMFDVKFEMSLLRAS